jgi:hypothetical protein
VAEIVSAFGCGKQRETGRDGRPEFLHGAPTRGAEQRFQLREPQFYRIQVGTVRRQVPQLRARRLDPRADTLDVMGAQVVHHDDIAGSKRRGQHLIEVGEKRVAVHRPIEQAGSDQALHTQGGDEGAGLPMLVGRMIVDARATATPAVAPQQVRGDATFIKKDEPGNVNRRGEALPIRPGRGDVGAILLGGPHRFF